jgi:hypothetical protein
VDLPKIGAAWSRSHNVIRWDSFKQFERIYIPIHNTQQVSSMIGGTLNR